jgi:hypothetical protein
MTANHDNIKALLATSTPTGILDHATIESRARQLRSEALRALLGASTRRVRNAWKTITRYEDTAHACNCGRLRGARMCNC